MNREEEMQLIQCLENIALYIICYISLKRKNAKFLLYFF